MFSPRSAPAADWREIMLMPELVAGIEPESALETSDHAATIEDITCLLPSEHGNNRYVKFSYHENE